MARVMSPRFTNNQTGALWGFRCGNCFWSYERQDGQTDFWHLLADARAMFEAHDCSHYQPARSPIPMTLPARSGMLIAKQRCPDCLGTGSAVAGVPCSYCEGTGLVSVMEEEDRMAS